MNKVFLYLYPIKEYTSMFLLHDDGLYDKWNVQRPLPILNECIQKRYRDNGYQIVYVLYPDKEIFGVIPKEEDRIIYTDILFQENSAIDANGKTKKDFKPKYPNEKLLIEQLGNIEELLIGGYHYADCVKRVGEVAVSMGIKTLVDLDLTDLFFGLYKQEAYFKIEEYEPRRYKEYIISEFAKYGESFSERQFQKMYPSIVYGFDQQKKEKDNNRRQKM